MRLVGRPGIVQGSNLDQVGEDNSALGILIGKFVPAGTSDQGELGVIRCFCH